MNELGTRKNKLDPDRGLILAWLKEHPDLSALQISDWLEERCSYTNVGNSTVRSYVHELREQYHIPQTLRTINVENEIMKLLGSHKRRQAKIKMSTDTK